MNQDRQRSTIGRFFASRGFLIIALTVMTLFAFGFARAYYQDYKVKQEIKELENEVKMLENKKMESIEILKYVTSNIYVEDKARTELNMKAPGEQVIFVQDMDKTIDKEDGLGNNNKEGRQIISNPVKWLYYFIHKYPSQRE